MAGKASTVSNSKFQSEKKISRTKGKQTKGKANVVYPPVHSAGGMVSNKG